MIWTFLTFIVNHILWLYIQDSEFSSSYKNMIFKYLNRFFMKLFNTIIFYRETKKENEKRKGRKRQRMKKKIYRYVLHVFGIDLISSPFGPGNSLGLGLFLVLPFICELCFLEKVDVPAVTRLQIYIVMSCVVYCFQSILGKQRWCRTLASL